MKIIRILSLISVLFLTFGCTPFDKIYSHDFSSGYFKLKTQDAAPEKVYLNLKEDSLYVYPVIKRRVPVSDTVNVLTGQITSVKSGSYFYKSTFVKTSADIDLSTVVLKFRPAAADVQPQLSANVNGVIYAGFRKDFYRVKSHFSPLRENTSYIRHTGFDFGLFGGIGITPVNPTVTENNTLQEYDGLVFQKGFAIFGTFEQMSVGLAIGFDNLLDKNKSIWIYNQKPWIGLVLGIANF